MKILLIDDEEQIREVIAVFIRSKGHEVKEAKNGEEGLGVLLTEKEIFDWVLTDFVMPGIDGLEVIRRVKTANPMMRLWLLSGKMDDPLRAEAKALGAERASFKPSCFMELKEVFEKRTDEVPPH